MALDLERPSSVQSRSSSPTRGDTAPRERQGAPAAPAHPLKFSIEKILSPDFGRRDSLERVAPSKDCEAPGAAGAPEPELHKNVWPAWVYCSRISDRPSSGPRRIRSKRGGKGGSGGSAGQGLDDDPESPRVRRLKKKDKKPDEKRPRTAFTADQLCRLRQEFNENRYLTEKRRQDLARDLKLHESQIKIWFQNRRAKVKKASGQRTPLALQLMAQGLYNHSTIPLRDDDDDERPKSSSSS